MGQEELKTELDAMMEDLFSRLQLGLEDALEGVTLTGSYAIGKFSPSRPDINFFLFLKPNPPAKIYLTLGEIFTDLIDRYADTFIIRPEFRPFKFSQPRGKGKLEVFLNPLIADLGEKLADPPFGISKNVLHGMKEMRKVTYGPDILGEMDLTFGKEAVVKSALRDLSIFKVQLIRAPSTYDLNKDYPLLFNESFIIGKMTLGWGLEVASSDEELRKGNHLEYFKNKEKMVDFYKKNYGGAAAESVKTILDARDHYIEWKDDKGKAYLLFTEAYNLINTVWDKLMGIVHGPSS